METINNFHRLQQQANAACDQCVEIARTTNDTRTQYLANKAAQLCLEICQCCNPEAPESDVQAHRHGNWSSNPQATWNQRQISTYQGASVPTSHNFERIQQLANEVCACCLELSRINSDPRIQFLANNANQCCLDVCQCCNVESKQVTRTPQTVTPNGIPYQVPMPATSFNSPPLQPYGFNPYHQ
jgi:hypothetical protein